MRAFTLTLPAARERFAQCHFFAVPQRNGERKGTGASPLDPRAAEPRTVRIADKAMLKGLVWQKPSILAAYIAPPRWVGWYCCHKGFLVAKKGVTPVCSRLFLSRERGILLNKIFEAHLSGASKAEIGSIRFLIASKKGVLKSFQSLA